MVKKWLSLFCKANITQDKESMRKTLAKLCYEHTCKNPKEVIANWFQQNIEKKNLT